MVLVVFSAFAVIGLGAWLYHSSVAMAPFTDERAFAAAVGEMRMGDSEVYHRLHKEMRTSKAWRQDMGISLLLLPALFLGLLALGRGRLRAPPRKWMFVLIAIVLPILSTGGFVFDLFQGNERREFPHWADSLSIPLMGVPVIFALGLYLSLMYLLLIKEVRASPVRPLAAARSNYWILALVFVTLFELIVTLPFGQYYYTVPSFLWLYYALSIGMTRVGSEPEQAVGVAVKGTNARVNARE